MKTKVIFTIPDFGEKKWEMGDEGYIDGYVCDRYGDAFACVVTKYAIVKAPIKALKVIGQLR